MLRILPDYELLQHSAERPIILAGPPDALTGEVHLANPGDDHIVVRSIRLRDVPRPSHSEIQVPIVAILRAGQGLRTRVTARLNPLTPPGRYQVIMALGNFTYPVELYVTENIDFDIDPSPLIIENRPGTRIEKQVLFRSYSNLDLKIHSPEALMMDEQDILCRIGRSGLAAGTENGAANFDQWLTTFLRQAHDNVRETGMLYMRNKDGETIVPPGESRIVNFLIRLPDTLKTNTRYFSVAYFYTETLPITIVPAGGSAGGHHETSEESDEHRQRRKSKPARS